MGSFGVTSHPFSHNTMKSFLFGILLVLGASINGQDAPEPAPADIGLIDCDALAIVMGALKSVNKDAEEKAEKAEEAKEKPDMAKPGMRQQETEGDEKEEDPKKTEEMINQFLDSLPPTTKANIKEIIKQLGLDPLFKLAQDGNLTDYDLNKAIADAAKAAGLKPEDVIEGVAEQCPKLMKDDGSMDGGMDGGDYGGMGGGDYGGMGGGDYGGMDGGDYYGGMDGEDYGGMDGGDYGGMGGDYGGMSGGMAGGKMI